MCGETIELVFDNWQCIVGRAVINNDKIVSMIFFEKSIKFCQRLGLCNLLRYKQAELPLSSSWLLDMALG
jgi:hypothetical protein